MPLMWVGGNGGGAFWELSEGDFQNEETGVTQTYKGTMAEAEIREVDEGPGLQGSAENLDFCISFPLSCNNLALI